MVHNAIFETWERDLLNFFLANDFAQRDLIVKQLNKLQHVVRDHTPYHWIMEFRDGDMPEGYLGMCDVAELQVLHANAPTVFILYMREGRVFEFEVYNADLSEMDLDTVLQGEIVFRARSDLLK